MAEEKKVERFENEDRAKLYEEANKVNYPEPEVKAEEPKPEQTPVEPEKKAETPPEPSKEEPKKEEPAPKKEKTVPYEALSAERIKRKAEAEERKKAEERARQLEDQLRKITESQQQPEFQTEEAKQLYDMGLKLKAIETLESERQKKDIADNQRRAQERIKENLSLTDSELSKEGYPGFKHSIGSVHEYLRQMVEQGQEEEALALDNPTGWKRIYRENIYPEIAPAILEAEKRRIVKDKVELKKEAGLVTVPGKSEPKPKSDEELSDEEYRQKALEMRRSYQRA